MMKETETLQEKRIHIERIEIPQGKIVNFKPSYHEIWLLEKGQMKLWMDTKEYRQIEKDQLFFLPQDRLCRLMATQKVYGIKFSIPELFTFTENFLPVSYNTMKENPTGNTYPLIITTHLREYLRHLYLLFHTNLNDHFLLHLQLKIFLSHLFNSYSPEQLKAFFSSIYIPHQSFSSLVYKNYTKAKNIRELAAMCHFSLRGFEMKFKQVFGEPPGKWLLQRRIETISHELLYSDLSLTLLADKYGFTTLSNLTDFCKKYLGGNPTEIRKKGRKQK